MQKKPPKKQTQILDNVKLWPVVQSFPLTVSLLSPEGGGWQLFHMNWRIAAT